MLIFICCVPFLLKEELYKNSTYIKFAALCVFIQQTMYWRVDTCTQHCINLQEIWNQSNNLIKKLTWIKACKCFWLNQLAPLTTLSSLERIICWLTCLTGAPYSTSELVKVAQRTSLRLMTDCSLKPTHTQLANEVSPQQKLLLITHVSN